jgi:hypothetical protein
MARDRTSKLMVCMPARYEPDFERRLDKRTVVGSALLARLAQIQIDCGGAESMSHAKASLCKRAVWIEAMIESHEQNLANGQPIDAGAYTQLINSLLGIYRVLGIERRQKPNGRTLRDYQQDAA